jgi:hypothetical protein
MSQKPAMMALRSRCRSTAGGGNSTVHLGGFGQDQDAYRIATERVQAIIDEEFGGEVTIRQRTAIRNDVLLGMFSEDLIVQHLSGQPRSSGRVGQRRTRFYFFFRFRHHFV